MATSRFDLLKSLNDAPMRLPITMQRVGGSWRAECEVAGVGHFGNGDTPEFAVAYALHSLETWYQSHEGDIEQLLKEDRLNKLYVRRIQLLAEIAGHKQWRTDRIAERNIHAKDVETDIITDLEGNLEDVQEQIKELVLEEGVNASK